MDKKEQILHYHRVDGLSLREIARRTGLNRKTVTRYVREYEAMVQSDPEGGTDMCLASKPKYPARQIQRKKLTETVCAEIEYWLAENAMRRQTGMRKQCLKRQDIHRVLLEKGFDISYSSVCKYIQRRKVERSKKPKEVFVKQWYGPGEECEFDWGEVKLRIGGKPVTFTMAVFALCHSEGRWAYQFRHQDNLAFMESHRDFFHDVHGVPRTMVYDNMKVAVILKPDGKRPTETLLRMEAFYGFGLVICDELGYVGFDKESAEMLFNHLSLRTGKKATIITTNLPFTRWEEVLKDKVLCSALVDRLCHKSYLVNMTGNSYRIKETKKTH